MAAQEGGRSGEGVPKAEDILRRAAGGQGNPQTQRQFAKPKPSGGTGSKSSDPGSSGGRGQKNAGPSRLGAWQFSGEPCKDMCVCLQGPPDAL